MATEALTVVIDTEAFRAACKERGAVTERQIADLMRMDRSSIWRLLRAEPQQKIGDQSLLALMLTFGPATYDMLRIEPRRKRDLAA